MTVAELIEELQKHDPNMEVRISEGAGNFGWDDSLYVDLIRRNFGTWVGLSSFGE